ncbi:MAG: hypothetical protein DI536_12755 [Archangium gephyra]|uniref:histidine kinase n=1 Tax=Archangium gephyra TaxID=48 RepID=A0A2W5VSM2_9BACT|nr:MAG: hypothetical protein DI536_12755 [Archangium gephyra]
MAFKDWSISLKVATVALVAAVLPAMMATIVVYSQTRQATAEGVERELAGHADRITDELDAFNSTFADMATLLSSIRSVQNSASASASGEDVSRARAVLASVSQRDARVAAVILVSLDGTVRIATNPVLEGASMKDSLDFPRAVSGRATISSLFVPAGAHEHEGVVSYTAPLAQGGYVAVWVRAEAFWDITRRLNDRIWQGSYVVVLDNSGVRVAHGARPDLLFHPSGALRAEDRAEFRRVKRFGDRTADFLTPVEEAIEWQASTSPTGGLSDAVSFAPNSAGQGERIATARRMKSVPWTVFSVVSNEAVNTPLSRQVTRLLWRTGLVVLLGFILAFVLAQRMVAPVIPLVSAARDLSRGLSPGPVAVDRADELGELTGQFNAMVKATVSHRAELEGRVEERTRSLTAANQELKVQQEELRAQQDELERKNQEVEKATQLKSAFLANMSHELRTPLNSVIGFSELLADELGPTLSDRHRKYLGDVRGAGKHLLSLINDILDLSKIEAGRLELRREAVSAAELLNHAQSLVGGTALSRQILITQDVRTTRSVSADPEKLRQALVNLLSNAIKFSPARSEVVLSAEDVGNKIRFSVRDNGPGIEASLLPRLFEPFVQGENPMVKKHQGTGLGLAISRRLVESH